MSAIPLPAMSWRVGRRPTVSPAVGGLKRVRWAVRATLLFGVAASVAANILHAQPHLVSQIIAAWPPVALLLTVELISRVPVHRMVLAAARLAATTAIAGIAAWVSYWHMASVAARFGETGLSAYLLPVSVDGLVIVASISLVELSGRLRAAPPTPPVEAVDHTAPPTEPAAARTVQPPGDRPHTPTTGSSASNAVPDQQPEAANGQAPATRDEPIRQRRSHNRHAPEATQPTPTTAVRRPRRGATRKAVLDTYRQNPNLHPTAIADMVGTSERSVRRYLDQARNST